MRRLSLLALLCLVGGIALLAYGAAIGQGQVALVLIFPVFTGTGLVSFAGMALLMLGMFLGFLSVAGVPLGALREAPPAPSSEIAPSPPRAATPKKFGGVVFLGPLPIVFGSDPDVSRLMLVLAIILTVLLVLIFFLPRATP